MSADFCNVCKHPSSPVRVPIPNTDGNPRMKFHRKCGRSECNATWEDTPAVQEAAAPSAIPVLVYARTRQDSAATPQPEKKRGRPRVAPKPDDAQAAAPHDDDHPPDYAKMMQQELAMLDARIERDNARRALLRDLIARLSPN